MTAPLPHSPHPSETLAGERGKEKDEQKVREGGGMGKRDKETITKEERRRQNLTPPSHGANLYACE